ncbi:MAG TPA: HK97-gp10 family putative phage morphogenesis protein [Alphaproteobacteria bacterium]|nr:HK97-gp10 family putative phage morphogenesis protein [Alphaproteobacteria bacterium]
MTMTVSFTPLSANRLTAVDGQADAALRQVVSRALDSVAADARANVAGLRDAGRPGPSALEASIRIDPAADGPSGAVLAGGRDAPYAAFVEFGTRRAAAQPFLGPALAANATRIRRDIAAAVDKGLGAAS